MADDDIEKLLREIDAMNKGQLPAGSTGATPQKPAAVETQPTRSRGAWTGVSAVGGLAVGWVVGAVLPFIGAGQTAIGAAVGGAAVALVSRPPTWFSRQR